MTSDIKLLTVLLFLALSACAFGEPLDEDAARYAAASFFSGPSAKAKVRARGRQLVLRSEGHEAGYYVFERPEGGVVFVADDDAIGRTVLGYTDAGGYDGEVLPDGLRDWLSQISLLMQAVHEGKIKNTDVRRKAGKVVVQALIRTRWNQGSPYNNLCPMLDGKRCITGCVATAMAQVMNYWRWPRHGYGSVWYEDPGCGQTLMQDLSENEYDWDNMLDQYSSTAGGVGATSVATLMRDCGYAVHMNYTPTASSASISANTMQQYFHYGAIAKDRYVNHYPEDMWHEFIRADLEAGRPVLYSGQSTAGGHEFILDGFDTEGYYHVNWGWGGYQDGWFMLTNLNGFNEEQWMINSLEPDYTDDDAPFSYTLSADGTLTISGTGMMPQEYAMATAPWKESSAQVRKIVIGEGITSIVDYFGKEDTYTHRFTNLAEIVLPEGLKSIGYYAFYEADALTSVQIPSTVVSMDNAFYNCSHLTSLHLPKGLEGYDDYVPGLVRLSVDEENPWLSVEDNILYSKDGRCLLYAPNGLSRVVIPEYVEELYDNLFRGVPLFFKSKKAPTLPYRIYKGSISTLYVPYESTGYTTWTELLSAGWKIMTYTDLNYFLNAKVDWSLQDGTLTINGWGELWYDDYGYQNAPYYKQRSQIKKLVVNEGVTLLCVDGFWSYYNMKEAELPATLSFIRGWCFGSTDIRTITCHAKTAPTLYDNSVFYDMPQNGTLRVPEGSNYSVWLEALPSGWKIEYFTPEPQIQATLYDGEQGVKDLSAWEKLLEKHPNAIGVVAAGSEYMAHSTRNLLVAGATSGDGYTCPYFRLTDLTSGYSSAAKAPQTGLAVPVAFTVKSGEYSRRLYAGYNTACLPFTVSEENLPEGCRMYAYSHFDSENNDAVFVAQDATEAGRACFITSEANVVWQADLAGVTIAPVDPSAQDDNMRGTFVTTDAYQHIGYNPRAIDNVFAPLEQYLHPFRACFLMPASAGSKLCIRLMDDADCIGTIKNGQWKLDNGNWTMDNGERGEGQSGIFSLDGKRIVSPRKGQPYIKNGKLWIK